MADIYKVTSPTGRIYIGSSNNAKDRFNCYKSYGCKKQVRLYKSLLKHGAKNHTFEIIEDCDLCNMYKREAYWGKFYDVLGRNGLNCKLPKGDETYYCIRPETLIKLRESHLGQNKGGTISEEQKVKIRIARKMQIPPTLGMTFTDEHKAKISASHIGELNPMYGKKQDKETIEKRVNSRRVNNKKRPPTTDETREKLRISHLGQKGFWTGKKQSKEAIEKRTETRRINSNGQYGKNNNVKKPCN